MAENTTNPVNQPEIPLALVQGSLVTELPKDLYIPPDALKVFLETFEGPLDLLLYLIKRQDLDILDISLTAITEQYIRYIELMESLQLELAGEYLLMAAMLAEIKSRELLPHRENGDEDGEQDPRAALIERLRQYECYKEAAEKLDELPRMERDFFPTEVVFPWRKACTKEPEVSMQEVLRAFAGVLKRADMFSHHTIRRENLSVRERMGVILEKVGSDNFIDFKDLFELSEGRAGLVVSLLAILQLVKDLLIQMVQNKPNGTIYVRAMS